MVLFKSSIIPFTALKCLLINVISSPTCAISTLEFSKDSGKILPYTDSPETPGVIASPAARLGR